MDVKGVNDKGRPHGYEKFCGSYYYYNPNGRMAFAADEVAIGYSVSSDGQVTMHKHGRVADVTRWLGETRDKLLDAGQTELAAEFQVVSSSKWDADELSKILSTPACLESFLRRKGLLAKEAVNVKNQLDAGEGETDESHQDGTKDLARNQ